MDRFIGTRSELHTAHHELGVMLVAGPDGELHHGLDPEGVLDEAERDGLERLTDRSGAEGPPVCGLTVRCPVVTATQVP